MELKVYMSDDLEFKDYCKSGILQLGIMKFVLQEPIILGSKKSKEILELYRNKKLKLKISIDEE